MSNELVDNSEATTAEGNIADIILAHKQRRTQKVKSIEDIISAAIEEEKLCRRQEFYEWLAAIDVKVKPAETAAEYEAECALLAIFMSAMDRSPTRPRSQYSPYPNRSYYREDFLRAAVEGCKVIPDKAVPYLVKVAWTALDSLQDQDEASYVANGELFEHLIGKIEREQGPISASLVGIISNWAEIHNEYNFIQSAPPEATKTLVKWSIFYTDISEKWPFQQQQQPAQHSLSELPILSTVDLAEVMVGLTIHINLDMSELADHLHYDPFVYIEEDMELPMDQRQCCATCMGDFVKNEMVRVLRCCGHILHEQCDRREYCKLCPVCRKNLLKAACDACTISFAPLLRPHV